MNAAVSYGAALCGYGVGLPWKRIGGLRLPALTPAQVAEAVCLEQLSYHEAWELSYFGANVLHPRTTLPAMKFRRALISAPCDPQCAIYLHQRPLVAMLACVGS